MALSGEDKDMRMQGSTGYMNSAEIQQERTRNLEPNSGGSKLKTPAKINYRECLKNHAASIGGNVIDGCGEFMPSGEEGTLEALKCAACDCHRNFHRKEYHGEAAAAGVIHPLPLPPPLPSPSMSQHRMGVHNVNHWSSMVQPVKMAFGSGGGGGGGSVGTDSSSEELNFNAYQSNTAAPPPPQFVNKKRFRTKFTNEQKDKMLEFAEKVGWRIPREDDTEVQRFCAEVGVKRQVFKVWMHNNKSSSAKKNPQEI